MIQLWLVVSLACVASWGLALEETMAYLPSVVLFFALMPLTIARSVRASKDLLNPLLLVCVGMLLRYGLPSVLAAAQSFAPSEEIFSLMDLTARDWILGQILLILGLTSVIAGWIALPDLPWRANRVLPATTSITAAVALLSGLAGLLGFVVANTTLSQALLTGAFRATEIATGTGVLFYLSLLSIPSAVILFDLGLTGRLRPRWVASSPLFFVALAFFILGGRTRALTPLLAGAVLYWYRRTQTRPFDRARVSWAFRRALIAGPIVLWFLYVAALYRGGAGIAALRRSLELGPFLEYVQSAVMVDIGQLHALAAAVQVGPGTLEGSTFRLALLWPASNLLGMEGRSAAIYLVERTAGFAGDATYGFLPSMVGDAFVNFGVAGVVVVCLAFGLALKAVYLRFREGRLPTVLYAIVMVYLLRMFVETVERWPEVLVVVAFAVATVVVASLLHRGRSVLGLPLTAASQIEHT